MAGKRDEPEEDPNEDKVAARFAERWAEFTEVERFLEYIRFGYGPLNAGIAVGWTPADTRRRMKDTEFVSLVSTAREQRTETIEQRVYELAQKSNPSRWAVEMALFCQASDRGWRPPTQRLDVNRNTKVEHTVVLSTVEAVRQLVAANDIAALQPGMGTLDDDIVEGEIVDPPDAAG